MGAGASTPSPEPPAATCPVDHKAREVWLQQHNNQSPHPPNGAPAQGQPSSKIQVPQSEERGAETCPVDHKTREIWLKQHDNKSPHPEGQPPAKMQRPLSEDREVSSIPRAGDLGATSYESNNETPSPYAASAVSHGMPSNSEHETGHDKASGNWIYPSEKQFFESLMRKGNTPQSTSSASDLATSVASIIPIHNAVNERAWQQILEWEQKGPISDPGSKKCGGPKLYSFRGLGVDPKFLSPRARVNGLLGYQLPFDRHDWVVERCGGEHIEYVIDFYQGRSSDGGASGLTGAAGAGKFSFYLDVRPKLNTFEGVRLRFSRFAGF